VPPKGGFLLALCPLTLAQVFRGGERKKGLVRGRMKHRNRHPRQHSAESCYGGLGLSSVSSCNRGNWSFEVQSPPFLAKAHCHRAAFQVCCAFASGCQDLMLQRSTLSGACRPPRTGSRRNHKHQLCLQSTSKAIKCRQKMGEKLLSKRDRKGIYLVFHGLISPASLRGRPCDYVSCITMTL